METAEPVSVCIIVTGTKARGICFYFTKASLLATYVVVVIAPFSDIYSHAFDAVSLEYAHVEHR